MEQIKKVKNGKELEKSLRQMLIKSGKFESINANGHLDPEFILSYLIENNVEAAKQYKNINAAFNNLKKEEVFVIGLSLRKVSEATLNKLILYEALVRPIKIAEHIHPASIFVGEIIKLPPSSQPSEYIEGDEWKSLLNKESTFKVGDKVLYCYKWNIVLDKELLHVVSNFSGKWIE